MKPEHEIDVEALAAHLRKMSKNRPRWENAAHCLRAADALLALKERAEKAEERTEKAEERARKWERIRTPTHGSCCTCQRCGQFYDDCRCDLDEAADECVQLRAAVERLTRERDEALHNLDAAAKALDEERGYHEGPDNRHDI